MTDDPVEQALAELHDLVRCRCHPAYTGRGLHDPDCECDSAETVKMVADRIEAQAAEIERLRGAMQEAIRLAEQPHYGDRGDALDHCFDAIDVLRETLAEQTGGKDAKSDM